MGQGAGSIAIVSGNGTNNCAGTVIGCALLGADAWWAQCIRQRSRSVSDHCIGGVVGVAESLACAGILMTDLVRPGDIMQAWAAVVICCNSKQTSAAPHQESSAPEP